MEHFDRLGDYVHVARAARNRDEADEAERDAYSRLVRGEAEAELREESILRALAVGADHG